MSARALLCVLAAFSAAMTAGSVMVASHGAVLSERIAFVWFMVFSTVVALWLREDCREMGIHQPLDAGFFIFMAWPLLVPYHLIRSRASRGIVGVLAIFGAFAVPYVAGAVVYAYS